MKREARKRWRAAKWAIALKIESGRKRRLKG